jgi:hypothetical protein
VEEAPRSLWAEWVGLILSRPLANGAWVAAAAAVLLLTTPLGALPGLLRDPGQEARAAASSGSGHKLAALDRVRERRYMAVPHEAARKCRSALNTAGIAQR